MMLRACLSLIFFVAISLQSSFAFADSDKFQTVLQENYKLIQRSSVKTVQPVLDAINASRFEKSADFLSAWQSKNLWFRKADNQFFYVRTEDKKTYKLTDVITGQSAGEAAKKEIKQIKPNSGVRKVLGSALVAFRLNSPDLNVRRASLASINLEPKPEHLAAVRGAVSSEVDADLKSEMKNLERLLTMQFGTASEERVQAIVDFDGDLNLAVRAKLNPLLSSKVKFAAALPQTGNIAREIIPGKTHVQPDGTSSHSAIHAWFAGKEPELGVLDAYNLLIAAGEAPEVITDEMRDAALLDNVKDGEVAGVALAKLNSAQARNEAYAQLVRDGLASPALTKTDIAARVAAFTFYAEFDEADLDVTKAAQKTLNSITSSVQWNKFLDLALDAISLASIYFLAAIGLAITFGVMRVINMAHGEFIMMGAYSGYVVQQFVTNYTLSIIIAIPVAFAVTFAAGVLLERQGIRHLYNRPLETLLATFGVSIALQQLAKNIFGTQARPLTSPGWLDGALVLNDVVSISWIRIAIFVLSVVFFVGLWWTLNKTRLGLETRAVVQNPVMAASMGINPDRINMLTFGLGSGIAGIAGVAIGLYAKVTSELGGDYIVQSFMTVVIGGVGNIWGTLAGAGLIGILQKLIEDFNPSNTLAAQTYMIIFIIIFIQFRPRGLIALKGRAVEA